MTREANVFIGPGPFVGAMTTAGTPDDDPAGLLDEVDWEILSTLQREGRTALTEIARRLDMASATIHDRVSTLEEAGYIRRYRAVLDPRKVGVDTTAFLMVRTTPDAAAEVAARVGDHEAVQEVHVITGEPDILCKVCVDSRETLTALVREIGAVEDVTATTTHLALERVKEDGSIPLNGQG